MYFPFTRSAEKKGKVRSLLCAILLVGSMAGTTASGTEQKQTGEQEGVQQEQPQHLNPAERAARTRAFLGLGVVPDKAAATRGAPLFKQNCGFCHGQAARGATGPSLLTSDKVLGDDHGEHLLPFLKRGLPEKGMPAFVEMTDRQLTDVAEFLHQQVEDVANRGAYHVLDIVVGNKEKGKAYVKGHCMSCHTAESFAHIASKFRSPEELQRTWIWPARSGETSAIVTKSGATISGRVTQMSDFRITLVDGLGKTTTVDRGPGMEVQLKDPLVAHEDVIRTLKSDDMHDATAYLETLK